MMWSSARANFNKVKDSRMLIKPIKFIKHSQQTQEKQTEVLGNITQKGMQLVSEPEEVVVLNVQLLVHKIGVMWVSGHEVSLPCSPNAVFESFNSSTALFMQMQLT
jgi:hypothetical protein